MKLAKGMLTVFYYYLLLTTGISFFIFLSTFNNIFDGNKDALNSTTPYVQLARLMWSALLGLHAVGLFAIIVLRRRLPLMSRPAVIVAMITATLFFILPSLYFMGHLILSSRNGV
jgi:MFS superfamily sulfate permease-like transporter